MNVFIGDGDFIDVIPEVIPEVRYFDECFRSYFIDVNGGASIVFNNLDELSTIIKLYERESNTLLRISKSNLTIGYRKYKCFSHGNCQFRATFCKRRIDNQVILKRNNLYHNHS